MSQYDYFGLYEFLTNTPESGLRKILIDQKSFPETHFNLMIKILRSVNAEQFSKHCESNDFPKIKMGPSDIKVKDKFWGDLINTCNQRGLLNPAQKSAA